MNFKKVLSTFLSLCLMIGVVSVQKVSATTNIMNTSSQEIVKSVDNNVFDIVSMDRATFQGSAGSCRLDYMSGSNSISWGMSLYYTGVASFVGTISIAPSSTSSNFYKTYYVSGTSGVVSMPYSMPQGSYTASFSGTAIGLDGKTYYTVPNAIIPFYKY